MNPTEALVLSQVVLSFGIPFALVPLVLLTCRRDVHAGTRLFVELSGQYDHGSTWSTESATPPQYRQAVPRTRYTLPKFLAVRFSRISRHLC
jgi:Mn2+/Fe2+ NRAMP family transporter